jgi:hypothetical protein
MKLWISPSDHPSEAPEYVRIWDAAQHERHLRRWQNYLTLWTVLLVLFAVAFAAFARALGRL